MKKLLSLFLIPIFLTLQGSTYFHLNTYEGAGLKLVSDTGEAQAIIQLNAGVNAQGVSLLQLKTLSDEWVSIGGNTYVKTITVSDKFIYQIQVVKGKDSGGGEHYQIKLIIQPISR